MKMEREASLRTSDSKGESPALRRAGSRSDEKGSESKSEYKNEGKSDSK